MEITGKIIAVLPARSGVSQRTGNEWKSQEFVLETQDQYPRKVCFSVFGDDKLQSFNIRAGEIMTVSIDIDAHEYNGRWFNSIQAWKVERPSAEVVQVATEAAAAIRAKAGNAAVPRAAAGQDDDLPF